MTKEVLSSGSSSSESPPSSDSSLIGSDARPDAKTPIPKTTNDPIKASLNLPPFWTLGFIILSWGVSHCLPFLTLHHPIAFCLGLALAGLAIALILWTARTLHRHQTTFVPHRQASHLVTAGPFRFSRHPIYLADLILLCSSGLIMGSIWPFLFSPLLAIILRQVFIIPEERMLQKHFPQEFNRWASCVRRWI